MSPKFKDPEAPEVLEAILERMRNLTREEVIQALRPRAAIYLCAPENLTPSMKLDNERAVWQSLLRWCYDNLAPQYQEMLAVWEPWVKECAD